MRTQCTVFSAVLAASFLLAVQAYGQWATVSPASIIHNFRSSSFVDEKIGFAAGWIGLTSGTGGVQSVVVRTTDGGDSWQSETINQVEVGAIHALDADRIIGVGRGYHCNCPAVVRSTDGGKSWGEETFPELTGGFQALGFSDAEHGIIGGGNPETGDGYILRTTDGWETFQTVFQQELSHVARIAVIDENTAYAAAGTDAGGENMIYKTVNLSAAPGSVEWEPVWTFEGFASIGGLDFVTENEGHVVLTVFDAGEFRGEEWITTNGGSVWTSQFSTVDFSLIGLDFLDADNGIAVGTNSAIIKTTDGGANWSEDITRVTQWLTWVEFVNPGIAYAVGTDGTIMKYDQSSSVPGERVAATAASLQVQVVPNPSHGSSAVQVLGGVPGEHYRLVLANTLGERVGSIELSSGRGELHTESLPAGTYFYRLTRDGKFVTTGEFVVR